MKTQKKTFDCVAFKRQAQESIYQTVRNMTHEEECAYFKRAATSGPLGDWWKTVRLEHHMTAPSSGSD